MHDTIPLPSIAEMDSTLIHMQEEASAITQSLIPLRHSSERTKKDLALGPATSTPTAPTGFSSHEADLLPCMKLFNHLNKTI